MGAANQDLAILATLRQAVDQGFELGPFDELQENLKGAIGYLQIRGIPMEDATVSLIFSGTVDNRTESEVEQEQRLCDHDFVSKGGIGFGQCSKCDAWKFETE